MFAFQVHWDKWKKGYSVSYKAFRRNWMFFNMNLLTLGKVTHVLKWTSLIDWNPIGTRVQLAHQRTQGKRKTYSQSTRTALSPYCGSLNSECSLLIAKAFLNWRILQHANVRVECHARHETHVPSPTSPARSPARPPARQPARVFRRSSPLSESLERVVVLRQVKKPHGKARLTGFTESEVSELVSLIAYSRGVLPGAKSVSRLHLVCSILGVRSFANESFLQRLVRQRLTSIRQRPKSLR